MSPEIPIITDPAQLADLAAELERETAIAVDLEADSMHSYKEKVCLLQFSTPARTVLVDPLALPDLDPLKPVLADPGIRKIFHAADYDIRCLHRDFAIEISGLFDTMICCQFLGEKKIGLADILKKYFQVILDKKYQRADWSKRPLEPGMIRYAAEDTRHLHRLAELLEEKIDEKGRAHWVAEEFEFLEQVRHNNNDPGPRSLRIKGARKLKPRQLGILEELLAWREGEAERRDTPPFKVMGNNQLLELARTGPADIRNIKAIKGFPPRLADRYGRKLLQAIKRGRAIPEADLPSFPTTRRPVPDPETDRLVKKLKAWRTRKAEELGMDPGIVINNALLEELTKKRPADMTGNLKKWQQEVLGPDIKEIVA